MDASEHILRVFFLSDVVTHCFSKKCSICIPFLDGEKGRHDREAGGGGGGRFVAGKLGFTQSHPSKPLPHK